MRCHTRIRCPDVFETRLLDSGPVRVNWQTGLILQQISPQELFRMAKCYEIGL